MSLINRGTSWLRHTWGWSNSASAWRGRLVGAAFLLAAALLIYLSARWLAFWQAAILWSGFWLALAACSRQGWILLFGPVLLYDMIRTGRRSRYSIVRTLYAGLLLFILCYMYLLLSITVEQRGLRRETAVLAESFFFAFIILQLVIVVLLTPAYVAGAIAEEKDRKTLEFLLATDLRNREIVLSKLLSRLANMALLLLTGLPILSLLQFIGGVDPQLVFAGFIGVGLTGLGIGSVSILISTLFKRPRDAISLTYLLMVAYVSLASVAMGLSSSRHPIMSVPIGFGDSAPTLNDAANVLDAGNPIGALTDVTRAISGRNRAGGRTSLAAELPQILERYAWFHLVLFLSCVSYSIVRLRSIALKQSEGGAPARIRWWQRYRPGVGEFPMLWKEFYIEGRVKLNWLIWIALLTLVLLTLGSGLWVLGYHLDRFLSGHNADWQSLSLSMNVWFRFAGTAVACLLLVMIGVRASTSITSERERDTFDSLILTPMKSEGMLAAKFVGSMTSLRLGWLWFGSMLVLAICTGGVHPMAVPFLIIAWFIYAAMFTMIGLWYSMICKSSMVSTMLTVFTTLMVGGGHWIITGCFCIPLFAALSAMLQERFPGVAIQEPGLYFIKFQTGLSPPAVLALWSFSWQELRLDIVQRQVWEWRIFCLMGLVLTVLACLMLWFAVLVPTFRRVARRVELDYQ